MFFRKPEAKAFAEAISARPPAAVGAPSRPEATIVVGGRRRPEEREGLGGRSGHRARLNVSGCMSYGMAKAASEAFLFKGYDFPHTDITPALA